MKTRAPANRGFTLVEVIVVIVIIGVLAGVMVIYVRPAIQSYLAVGRRAGLTNQADTALRTMTREIRSAVPNSIRLENDNCVEFVPTSDGGRFRTAPDTVWDESNPLNKSEPLELTEPVSKFDVLTPFYNVPAVGDIVVIGNQNRDDVYTNANRGEIASVATPAASAPENQIYRHRITLQAPASFPPGYEGGRFVVVPAATKAVTYRCDTANGKLLRYSGYGFNATQTCSFNSTVATSVIASKVASCSFTYNPNAGATQESGYLEVQLRLSEENESVTLIYGAHVDNLP